MKKNESRRRIKRNKKENVYSSIIEKTVMKKEIFKVGDKVFDITFGWGIVREIRGTSYPVKVIFPNNRDIIYTLDGKISEYLTQTLSFTEYTLNGFSQERPIELPEVGEEIMVSDNGATWYLATFSSYNPDMGYKIEVKSEQRYKYFKRLRG